MEDCFTGIHLKISRQPFWNIHDTLENFILFLKKIKIKTMKIAQVNEI